MLKDKFGRPLTIEAIKDMWEDAEMCASYQSGMTDPLDDKAANAFYEAMAQAEARGATEAEIEAVAVPMPTWTWVDETAPLALPGASRSFHWQRGTLLHRRARLQRPTALRLEKGKDDGDTSH